MVKNTLTRGLALDTIVPPSDIATLAYRIGTGELNMLPVKLFT